MFFSDGYFAHLSFEIRVVHLPTARWCCRCYLHKSTAMGRHRQRMSRRKVTFRLLKMSHKPVNLKRAGNTADDNDEAEHLVAKKGIVTDIWARNQSDAVKLNLYWAIGMFSLFPK